MTVAAGSHAIEKDLAASGLQPEGAITFLCARMQDAFKEHCHAFQVPGEKLAGIKKAGDREKSRHRNDRPERKVRDGGRH